MIESARIAATFAVAAACAAGAVAAQGGCTLRCDTSTAMYGDTNPLPGAGVVDVTTWESGPIDGTWIDYPGQRVTTIDLPTSFPGPYTDVEVYLSASPQANAVDSNWTLATGNLAEVREEVPGDASNVWSVIVKNDTCAPYYARIVVHRALMTTTGTPGDAGSD